MTKCKHDHILIIETIEAYHQRVISNNGHYYCNNEFGGRVRVTATCNCGYYKYISPTNQHDLPKWLKLKIHFIEPKDWFFMEMPKLN